MAETVSAIRISTRLKMDGIKKDRKELERQLKQIQKNVEAVSIQKEIDKATKAIETAQAKADSLRDKIASKVKEDPSSIHKADLAAEKAMNGLSKDATDEERSLAAQKAYQEALNQIVEKEIEKSKEYQKQSAELEKIKSTNEAIIQAKQLELAIANQMNDEEKEKKKRELESVISAERHNNSIKKGIKLFSKMSLAVFGVRAAYAAMRKIVSSVTEDNVELKNTIDAIWAGLGSVFEPLINGLIKGFATVLNYAFAILSVLTGINLISKANQKLANKKGGKSGSRLASFDNSEVLKKDSGSSTANYLKEIELNEKLLGIVEKIKSIWISIMDIIGPVFEWLWVEVLEPVASFFIDTAIPTFFQLLADAIGWVNEKLEVFGAWLQEHPELLNLVATALQVLIIGFITFNALIAIANIAIPILSGAIAVLSSIIGFFASPLGLIIGLIALLITNFGDWGAVIEDVQLILDGLMNFITGVFTGNWEKAWLGIHQIFAGVWNGILDIVQTVINGLCEAVNAVIRAINGISFDVPSWVPIFGGSHFGPEIPEISNIPSLAKYKWIPKLAKGAVLPPNKPFVAQLGDQTHGRNLEAPEDLIRQIVREETQSSGNTIIIKADGDLGALVRLLKFRLNEEDERVGTTLVLEG